jgi:hypothetical protein
LPTFVNFNLGLKTISVSPFLDVECYICQLHDVN